MLARKEVAMLRKWLVPLFMLLTPCLAFSDVIVLDFENFQDSDNVTTQVPGMTFTDGTVLSGGVSLNEFEFPPASGTNVVFDNGGPIRIDFADPILSFGGLFTYAVPITITAFGP